ncbi:MAG: precorrin-3B C(17)-methyltransferase [Nitrospirae bacterium]|nr:precorrin-3B C(17)-methyltransferase [Nitrospirota bacterium]
MATESKTAFYITDSGLALADKLRNLYPDIKIVRYSSAAVADSWATERGLIFIMAAGIVVRSIAALIKDKHTDPGVVVLDDKGQFVISLLSGHLGGANGLAAEVAQFLGGKAVITTASDVNNLPALDLWAEKLGLAIDERGQLSHTGTRLLDNGSLNLFTEIQVTLPDAFINTDDPSDADVLITNKKFIASATPPRLYLRPKNLVVGIGCNSGTSADEIESAITNVLDKHNLSFLSVGSLATIDLKASEPGLLDFARKYGLGIITFTPDELNRVPDIEKSEVVFKATGAYSVSEAAARIASGETGEFIVRKQKIGNVTLAVAVENAGPSAVSPSCACPAKMSGKIYVVGTGPGRVEHITPHALDAIGKSQAIVGYGTYLDLITDLIKDKEVISTGMTQEIDRCRAAVELALGGKTVAVVSGGDPGIYAMAGLVLEILRSQENRLGRGTAETTGVAVEVIPGISALNAGASRLGAPLMHDFAVISLSDRLTPWELIEKRLKAAAMADFVIVLYNPKSMGRPDHIDKARAICLRYRSAETPVGIVKAAMRENEKVIISNLRDMLNHDIDMQTTVFIGNSSTFAWNNMMITPRGYTASREQTNDQSIP